MRAAHVVFALALSIGCSAQYPDGRYACDATHACPPGLTCSAGLCYHTATDAAVDGGGSSDGASPDGSSGCSSPSGCITINFTNAFPNTPTGTTMSSIGGAMIPLPAYGETAGPFTIPIDATGNVSVTLAPGAPTVMLPAMRDHMYVLVGTGTGIPTLSASLYDLDPSILPSATAGTASIVFIDLLGELSNLMITRNHTIDTMWPMSRTAHSAPITLMAGDTLAFSRFGSTDDLVLAGFSARDFPVAGAFYVVLAGETAHHLAAPDGIRAIPAVVGEHAHPSRELFVVLNATDIELEVCRGAESAGFANVGTIMGPRIGFDGMGGATIDLVLSADGCPATAPNHHSVTLSAPRPGRYLIAAVGDTASAASWSVTAALEPAPAASAMTHQAIGLVNVSSAAATFTGEDASGTVFGASLAPAGMPGAAFATALPTRIDVMQASSTVSFAPWSPVSSAAFAVFVGGSGSASTLWALDAPFGHGWTDGGYLDSTTPVCVDYCNTMVANCTGTNAQFADLPGCYADCTSFAWPTVSLVGDTIGCRTSHAMMTSTSAAIECPRAGPLGGGTCSTTRCGAFCNEINATCGAASPFASFSACTTACTAWSDATSATGPAPDTAAAANTLACRMAGLEAAVMDSTICASLGASSTMCP
jgi:hypothetical protein